MTFVGYGWTSGTNYESTVTNTFDGGNRLTQSVDSISGTITRGYDGLDRLTSETTPGSNTVSYTYDNAGRRASLTVPGQSVVNYTFDNANRLTQITQGSASVSFSYDNANRRTTLTLPNGIMTTYSYDNGSQLTGLTYTSGSTTLGTLTYTYDLNGRRTNVGGSYARTGLPNAVGTTAYNANNQLATWGSASLSFDMNGNMTSDGTHSYTWDARNHLKQIDSGTTASFIYDPFGRRTSKSISGTQTGFLYDGVNPVQELSGSTVTANSLMGGVDEVFQRTDSSGARNFLTDALGSTIALTDSSAAFQTTYSFDAYGNTSLTGSSTTNSFAYTGRELDAGNLYYYRARYYNPSLQRFISEDPIGFHGGDVNLYAYTSNSPTSFIDPSGNSNSLIHLAETYLGARDAGLGIWNSTSLAGLSVAADFFPGSQHLDAGDTNIHAMAGQLEDGSYQSPEQAFQGTADAIHTFADVQDNYGDALAIHAIEDSYSDSHNYQPDNDPNLGLKPHHALPDLGYHWNARDAVRDYLLDRMHGRKIDPKRYLNPPPKKYLFTPII